MQGTVDEQLEKELLQSLTCNYEDYKDFNPRKVEGTCEWFFDDHTFCRWRDSGESGFLWVSAGPGCGKSVLSRAMIDEPWRLSTSHNTPIVCYFFFKDGNEDQMFSAGALRAVIHQLLTQDSSGKSRAIALRHYRFHGQDLARNFSVLWNILIECAETSNSGVICLLDALDECEGKSKHQLIAKLLHHFGVRSVSSDTSSWIKFLITSRPYDDLETSFRRLSSVASYLRLDGDEKYDYISKDIDRVIDDRLDDIARGFTKEHRDTISKRLKNTANRTYLWLYLNFDIIQRNPSEYGRRSDIERLLSIIPSQVSDVYETILHRSKNKERTTCLLQIVLVAARPLTLDETNIALTSALAESPFRLHTDLYEALWPSNTFKIIVRNLCGLFISVYDSKLFFIHQTAREFLLDSRNRGEWRGRIKLPEAHSTLSRVCLNYLRLQDLPHVSPNHRFPHVDHSHNDLSDVEPSEPVYLPNILPFQHYAAVNWSLHFNFADHPPRDQLLDDARALLDINRGPVMGWAPWYFLEDGFSFAIDAWTDLVLASSLGLGSVVRYILAENRIDVNERSRSGHYSALCIASEKGHVDIVRLLLSSGARLNSRGGPKGRSAFLCAVVNGHEATGRLLLDNGADIDFRDYKGRTALHFAAAHDRLDLVRFLVDRGADMNVRERKLATPLIEAARRGHKSAVQLLVDRGARVNVRDRDGMTALHYAAHHLDISRILLEGGADVHIQTKQHMTALQLAVYGARSAEIARLLLAHGAQANAQSAGRPPLYHVALLGLADMTRLLLAHGADVDIRNGDAGTALHAVSGFARNNEMAVLLLDNGADINAQCGVYGTPLQAASSGGNVEIVKLLLERGADVNIQGGLLDTALQAAAARGLGEVVQMLLDKGASVDLQGGLHGTPLRAAIDSGHEEVARILRAAGAKESEGYHRL